MRDSLPVRSGIAASGMSCGLKTFCVLVTRVVPGAGQVTATDAVECAGQHYMREEPSLERSLSQAKP
jgi:hypothetical protein